MKIVYHHRTQAEDAQGVHIQEMVHAFRQLGHEVRVVALVDEDKQRRKGEASDSAGGSGLWKWVSGWMPDWLYELMSLSYNFVGYRKLMKAVREFQPDMIYERYALNTFCGIWAGRRAGIPVLLEVNAPLSLEQKALGRLVFERFARFSESWICSNSTHTFVVSEAMRQLLISVGAKAENMSVLPNGVNPEHFRPEVSGEKVRDQYGLGDAVVVGFVGWFRPWHGLEFLLETFHEGRYAGRNVKLLFVGDGPAAEALQDYTSRHDLEQSVIFTGPVGTAAIPEYVAAMDVAVQPKVNGYACPMKIIEYLGAGKAIIAPDQPNIRELLTNGQNALLFTPDDRESLREALDDLLGDRSRWQALAAEAARTIQARGFLWTRNAQRAVRVATGDPVQDPSGVGVPGAPVEGPSAT